MKDYLEILELTTLENTLNFQMISIQGTMDEKWNKINTLGIFNEYKQLHLRYANLANRNIEALKRGLFILWYARAEPACFSGINQLESLAEEKIIDILNKKISDNSIDYELSWMFDWYASWDYLFESFKRYTGIQQVIMRLKECNKFCMPKQLDLATMKNRGQMGSYWYSILSQET